MHRQLKRGSAETIAEILRYLITATSLALFFAAGFTSGTFNERFLGWLNYQLDPPTPYTSLPGAMQAYAVALGARNWDSLNTITDLQA